MQLSSNGRCTPNTLFLASPLTCSGEALMPITACTGVDPQVEIVVVWVIILVEVKACVLLWRGYYLCLLLFVKAKGSEQSADDDDDDGEHSELLSHACELLLTWR